MVNTLDDWKYNNGYRNSWHEGFKGNDDLFRLEKKEKIQKQTAKQKQCRDLVESYLINICDEVNEETEKFSNPNCPELKLYSVKASAVESLLEDFGMKLSQSDKEYLEMENSDSWVSRTKLPPYLLKKGKLSEFADYLKNNF